MVILITGASHTGKTLLAQRMLEKYYVDVAMERTINAFEVAQGVARAVNHEDDTWSWFIS